MSYVNVTAKARGSVSLSDGIFHFDPERSDEDGRYQSRVLKREDALKAQRKGLVDIDEDSAATQGEYRAQQQGLSARPATVAAERLEQKAEDDGLRTPLGGSTALSTSIARNYPEGQGPESATARSGVDPDAAPGGGEVEQPEALKQSIPKLEEHLKTVDDVATIDTLISAEEAGQNRDGALKALKDRKEELGGSE